MDRLIFRLRRRSTAGYPCGNRGKHIVYAFLLLMDSSAIVIRGGTVFFYCVHFNDFLLLLSHFLHHSIS